MMMNYQTDPLAMPVIKQELDDVLVTPLEGWSPLTGNSNPTNTNSSRLPSSTTTQPSVENQYSFPPTIATSSNHSSTLNSIVHKRPNNIDHHVKKKIFNLQFQLKQTQEQLKESTKDHVQLQLEYAEFKTYANAKFYTLDTVQMEKDKLQDELMQQKLDYAELKTSANAKLDTVQMENDKLHEEIKQQKLDYAELETSANAKLDTVQMEKDKLQEELMQQKLDYAELNTKLDTVQMENDKLQEEIMQLKNQHQTRLDQITQTEEANMHDVMMIPENDLIDESEDNLDQDDRVDEISNMGNYDNSDVESHDLSTSKAKPRQTTQIDKSSASLSRPKRTRSKPTVLKKGRKSVDMMNNEVNEDVNSHKKVDKIKVLHLNCTQPKCRAKLSSMKHLHGHLAKAHKLLPFRCFAKKCNLRFDNRNQMAAHLKLRHSKPTTKFVCPVCRKEYPSQSATHVHWNKRHLSGQFQCNLNECDLVFDTRVKLDGHQRYRVHCAESNLLKCRHKGCSLTFPTKRSLDQHQLVHRDSRPFRCEWPRCKHRNKRRADLLTHIRVRHFGLPSSKREQKAKNIVEERDPNDYVRVVEEEEDEEEDDEDTE